MAQTTLPPTVDVSISGTLLEAGTGEPVFGARIRHAATRRAGTSDRDGKFSISIPGFRKGRRVALIVLAANYWPKQIHVDIEKGLLTKSVHKSLTDDECAVIAIPSSSKLTVQIASWIGPRVLLYLLGLTRREQFLHVIIAACLLFPVFGIACDWGLRLPYTDADDRVRELIQRVPWYPSKRPLVRFSAIREVYRSGVNYEIQSAKYEVKDDVKIEPGAHVTIQKGALFRMHPGSGFLVEGLLKATGTQSEPIRFERFDDRLPWRNVCITGRRSMDGVLEHCEVVGGGGRGILASDTGAFILGNGDPVGGGLLLMDTCVRVSHTLIKDCKARYGGGLYIRNTPGPVDVPGSKFDHTTVEGCEASSTKVSGGGGVLIKSSYPEFSNCRFTRNRAVGAAACGGGMYIGVDARVRLIDCHFTGNTAAAEGGGFYAVKARDKANDVAPGVYFERGTVEANIGTGTGGGASLLDSSAVLKEVKFKDNEVLFSRYSQPASAQGGALCLKFGGRPLNSTSTIEACVFERNKCEKPDGIEPLRERDFSGGALHIGAAGPIKILFAKLIFSANSAAAGSHVSLPLDNVISGWGGSWDMQTTFESPAHTSPAAVYRVVPERPSVTTVTSPLVDWSRPLPSACYGDRPEDTKVDTVVLHFISDRTAADPYDRNRIYDIFAGQHRSSPEKVSAHYLLERDGTVLGLVDESKRAWHAGFSMMPDGRTDVNSFSIGIEMVRTAEDAPTDKQWKSLLGLLCDIKRRHPGLVKENIVGHDAVRARWNSQAGVNKAPVKDDPGPMFDWMHLARMLGDTGFDEIK